MYLTNKTEENWDPTLNITIYSIKDTCIKLSLKPSR